MSPLLNNLAHHTLSVLGLVCILLAAFGLGRLLQRALRIVDGDQLAVAVWSVGLGLTCGGLALTLLGFAGLLYIPLIASGTAMGTMAGVFELIRFPNSTNRALHPARPSGNWVHRSLCAAIFAVLLLTFLTALAPPTAGDALCYHLELPKAFLNQHQIAFLPYSDNSTFPLLGEMLYLWGLAIGGGTTAQLLAWATGALLALATVLLARPWLGDRWAWLAGAMVLLVPGITTHMTAPLCDLTVSLWLALALCAWQRSFDDERSQAWQTVAGIMFSAALATKYLAILFVAAFTVVWIARWWRQRSDWQGLPRALMQTLLIAAALSAPWYLRALIHRGDPFFPFLTQALGRPSSSAPEKVDKTPLKPSPWALFVAPWQITMHAEHFGGRSHQLGPLFLMLLPGLALVRRLRGLGTLLSIAAIYASAWFCLRQNVRFLYPIVPLLSVACTWAIIEIGRMPAAPRAISRAAVAAAFLIGMALPVYRIGDRAAVALGTESREAFLQRCEPSYNAATIVNQLAGQRAKILSEDYRGFYYRGEFTRESVYRRLTNYDRQIPPLGPVSRHLKQGGFTHLVLVSAENCAVRHDDTLARLVEAELAAYPDPYQSPLLPLANYPATDPGGDRWRYRLYEIR